MAKPSSSFDVLIVLVEQFLNENYAFRCEKQYKGIWGRLNAWLESQDEEERARQASKEHYWQPEFLASDPNAYELYYQEFVERHKRDNFSLNLMRLIESKGLDPVEVYKKAHIDRRLFSKIKTNYDYLPSKKTVFALALGMELDLDETCALLKDAGYYLSRKLLFDVLLEFFIREHKYNIDEINAVLMKYKQPVF